MDKKLKRNNINKNFVEKGHSKRLLFLDDFVLKVCVEHELFCFFVFCLLFI